MRICNHDPIVPNFYRKRSGVMDNFAFDTRTDSELKDLAEYHLQNSRDDNFSYEETISGYLGRTRYRRHVDIDYTKHG